MPNLKTACGGSLSNTTWINFTWGCCYANLFLKTALRSLSLWLHWYYTIWHLRTFKCHSFIYIVFLYFLLLFPFILLVYLIDSASSFECKQSGCVFMLFLLYQSNGFQLVICASPGVPERFKGGVLRKYIAEEILLTIWIASRPEWKEFYWISLHIDKKGFFTEQKVQ